MGTVSFCRALLKDITIDNCRKPSETLDQRGKAVSQDRMKALAVSRQPPPLPRLKLRQRTRTCSSDSGCEVGCESPTDLLEDTLASWTGRLEGVLGQEVARARELTAWAKEALRQTEGADEDRKDEVLESWRRQMEGVMEFTADLVDCVKVPGTKVYRVPITLTTERSHQTQRHQANITTAIRPRPGTPTIVTKKMNKVWDFEASWIETKQPKKDRKTSQGWKTGRTQRQLHSKMYAKQPRSAKSAFP